MIRRGELRAEKTEWADGVSCSIWRVFSGSVDDSLGICWDFEVEELDDILALLTELRDIPAEPYQDDGDD